MKVLLVGFGDLASRLAPRLVADNCQVAALRRSQRGAPGVELFCGDCRDPGVLGKALAGRDVVVVTLTPGAFTEQDYRDTYVGGARALAGAIASGPGPGLVIWVSSTSVHGQCRGEWVDEDSITEPRSFSGRALLAAEAVVAGLPVPATVVRFSGIYGPGRTRLIEQVRRGLCAPAQPVQWSNRIHSEDCAAVLHHLIRRHASDQGLWPLYLASDCEPAPLHEVHLWLARRLGVTVTGGAPPGAARGNRRCRNKRLLASGYRFLYPSYREGYDALVSQVGDNWAAW